MIFVDKNKGANSQPDHAQTRISRIVVDVPLNQR